MTQRRIIKVLATGAMVAGLVAGMQGAATASSTYTATAVNVSNGPVFDNTTHCIDVAYHGIAGTVCYQPYGDKFWVRDGAADGHHIDMFAEVNTTEDHFLCSDYSGKAADWTACSGFSGQIPEHARIGFSASVVEGDDVIATSTTMFSETT